MFSRFRSSHPRHTTAAMARALTAEGLPPGTDATSLSVVEQRGSYAGRSVSYFRVYDPLRTAERQIDVRVFSDLDAQPGLILGSGHLERDGSVVLARQPEAPSPAGYVRVVADRAQHDDDERFVFPRATS